MTLVKFNGFNGYEPNAGLLIDSTGNLFGTTTNGGPIGSNGTVLEIDASTNILTTLAAFAGELGVSASIQLDCRPKGKSLRYNV